MNYGFFIAFHFIRKSNNIREAVWRIVLSGVRVLNKYNSRIHLIVLRISSNSNSNRNNNNNIDGKRLLLLTKMSNSTIYSIVGRNKMKVKCDSRFKKGNHTMNTFFISKWIFALPFSNLRYSRVGTHCWSLVCSKGFDYLAIRNSQFMHAMYVTIFYAIIWKAFVPFLSWVSHLLAQFCD